MAYETAALAAQSCDLLAERDALERLVVAQRTRCAYEQELRGLDCWLAGATLNDHLLSLYVTILHRDGKSPSAIGMVIAAAEFRAKQQRVPSPVGHHTRNVARGARRRAAVRGGPRQADSIGWQQADLMAECAAARGAVGGIRDAAVIAVASDAMLRVSELAALNVEDVTLPDAKRDHALVVVRTSKTDQEGAGRTLYCGPSTAQRLMRWMQDGGVESGPLFRPIRKNGAVQNGRLGTRSLQNIVKRCAADADIKGRITCHSLRIGSAQELAERRVSLVALQQAGRWKSPQMPALYIREQLAERGAVAQERYGAGNASAVAPLVSERGEW